MTLSHGDVAGGRCERTSYVYPGPTVCDVWEVGHLSHVQKAAKSPGAMAARNFTVLCHTEACSERRSVRHVWMEQVDRSVTGAGQEQAGLSGPQVHLRAPALLVPLTAD